MFYTEKHVTESINPETGEILSVKTTERKKDKPRRFTMVFHETIAQLNGLLNNEGMFFASLLKNMNDDCVVGINAAMKRRIMQECNVKCSNPINRASQILTRLQHKRLVKKCGGGDWMLNPNVVGRNARWSKINKLIDTYAEISIKCDMKNNTRVIEIYSK
ncbi:MAG TPA: hypothetical protein ENI67_04825 [Gammaproteobacteria bacterium]|nr:hypothetical protein [Gammaproteobacteria bacterium]